jgi:RNA 3'-terminal phosphate cyclase-like protein
LLFVCDRLEFEINLLHLIEKLTNGSKVEINATGKQYCSLLHIDTIHICSLIGTSLYYAPGALNGGIIEHECSLQRSIGYYLEFVLYVAPFMKTALELRLKGVTNDRDDPSVD